MYAEDKNGNEFIVQATTKNDNEVNGNQSLQGDIEYNKVNAQFINEIDSLWKLYDHEGKTYKIITLNRKGKGDKMYITFTAIPLFFDYMDTDSIFDDKGVHYKYDGHFTAKNAFDKIFTGTPFDYVLVDSAEAVEWENFGGGESRLESFKRALDRYHYEFEIRGNTVYLKNQAGRDTSIQYRHRFNASDINQEIDASEQITGIKGYGNFGEGTSEDASEEDYRDARLKREYVSPLAHVIDDKIRWGFFADGRMKVASAMDKKLKSVVENSLKVSVNATIHNLTKQGYPIDVSQAGDRVFLVDERIGFNQEVRIISQSITRNWLGEIIDASITFGDEGLGKRHQSNISTVTKQIGDIFSGKAEMPLSHLDKRVQEISNIINGNTDSIFKYTPNGVIGWNGTDPNYMTKYVGDSIGFSRDGGETYGTAMSADQGIVADYINTGTLRAIMVEGVEIYGSYFESRLADNDYLTISGARLESRGNFNRTWRGVRGNHDIKIRLENGYVRARNDTKDQSLYFSDMGVSTYADAEGEGTASGTLAFRDYEYSGNAGVTLHSTWGKPALESSINSVVLAPHKDSRSGTNLFEFGVKDNSSWEDTDGWISFGDVDTKTYNSGIRFSKQGHIIYATNGAGDIGTGQFDAETFRGELVPRGAYNYLRASRTRFVRPGIATDNYADIQFAHAIANTIRVNDGGADFYIGASTGEVRVTNNLLYNGGNTGYRPIRTSKVYETSSEKYKSDIQVYDKSALSIINESVIYDYIKEGSNQREIGLIIEREMPRCIIDKDAVDGYSMRSLSWKAIQELSQENKQLKSRLHKIEKLLEVV